MSDFLMEMGVLSAARAAVLDTVALDAKAHHMPSPLAIDRDGFGIIAEVKFSTPSEGTLDAPLDPVQAAVSRAEVYAQAGACAISVLTEPTRFGGDLTHLAAVAAAVDVPVMRKDFLVDPAQVLEARVHGAAGVLLIVRMLSDARLDQMVELAHELDMFVLLEAFDEDDLSRAARFPGTMVGLNCRDLSTLGVDPERFAALIDAFPSDCIRVAESGLRDAHDIHGVAEMGYEMALVGSALMSASDPGRLIEAMRNGRGVTT